MKNQTEKTPVPLSEMTLRDFFAVFAMQAIISKFPLVQDDGTDKTDEKMIVRGAYNYADAMMEERK